MGLKLVITSIDGKDGSGKITFYPHSKGDASCMGEFNAALLLDNGRLRVSFYRPTCDAKEGRSYIFTVKEGGKNLRQISAVCFGPRPNDPSPMGES